jgi:predicted N-acetyltransferase YhbS
MSIQFRLAAPAECSTAEALAARAFGPGRYAKSAYRLREGVNADARLHYVAVKDGQIAGTIQYWPMAVGGALCALLGPLAVEERARGHGAGLELMRLTLPLAAKLGYAAAILVGDEPYYAKVGFTRVTPGTIEFAGPVNPARFLILPFGDVAPTGKAERAHLDEPQAAAGCGLANLPRAD